jgi:RNA polymerase sigma-70 factor (ECF subfamily)
MINNRGKLDSRLKRKDIKAYKKLFFKFHGRLVLFANKFTGDLQISQDLVQDAFLNLWKTYDSQTKVESPKAYLFQAVKNSCLNHQRHLKIKYSVEEKLVSKINSLEKSVYYAQDDPYQSLLELELERKIEETVDTMPDKCRQVYKMSRHNFLKNKQIANKLGISVKMVEKHISKALLIMRTGLSEYIGILLLIFLGKI